MAYEVNDLHQTELVALFRLIAERGRKYRELKNQSASPVEPLAGSTGEAATDAHADVGCAS